MKDIWIADDDQSIRFVLEKALAREQLAVGSFANARDVLAALDDDEPQVLVSDIRMPGGSGLDLLAKIKQRLPEFPNLELLKVKGHAGQVGNEDADALANRAVRVEASSARERARC